jgi:hypothetical protein
MKAKSRFGPGTETIIPDRGISVTKPKEFHLESNKKLSKNKMNISNIVINFD